MPELASSIARIDPAVLVRPRMDTWNDAGHNLMRQTGPSMADVLP